MSENVLTAHSGYAGWFKIEAHRVDANGDEIPGTRRVAADWFPNLITNAGLDFLGTTGPTYVYTYCRVGSGNTAPAFTDPASVAPVAAGNPLPDVTEGGNRTGTFYAWRGRSPGTRRGWRGPCCDRRFVQSRPDPRRRWQPHNHHHSFG